MSITTTKNGFRVEDVTFKNPRMQSEILNEGVREDNEEEVNEVEVPTSLTPEQVISFYESKIRATKDTHEIRLYSQTIKWIKELLEARSKINTIRERELLEESHRKVSDDIQSR